MSKVLPAAVASATVTLLGVEVEMYVLDTGQRIIEADSFDRLLTALFSDGNRTEAELQEVARAISGQAA